jgi:antirestriction protein ArdC
LRYISEASGQHNTYGSALTAPPFFESPEAFASVALHEASHWSGGKDRLDRDLTSRFGSAAYAREELRAELASVFLGKALDLPADIPNHASYLGTWIETLKADKREIFRAASDAQRIADYLLAFHPDYANRAGYTDISTDGVAPSAGLAAERHGRRPHGSSRRPADRHALR